MVPDESLVANELQSLFGTMKCEQQGRPYRPAERFRRPEMWIAIARKCIELQASPYDFLTAAFRYCAVPGGPFPHQLATNAAATWYGLHKQVYGHTSSNATLFTQEIHGLIHNAAANLISMAHGQNTTLKTILLDENMLPDYVAPAFVRVLLMPWDPAVREAFGRRGRLEILSNPRLLKTLKELRFDLSWMEP